MRFYRFKTDDPELEFKLEALNLTAAQIEQLKSSIKPSDEYIQVAFVSLPEDV